MQRLPTSLRRTSLFLSAFLAIAYLAGCGDVTAVHVPGGPRADTFVEREPNDSPFFPDFVTVVDTDTFLLVDGHVEAFGFDVVDYIEFEASEPVEIEFFLEAFGPHGDVDVSIYDPIDDVILATYAIDGAFESGTIVIHEPGRPFQFVIDAYMDDSAWTLELVGYPYVYSGAAAGGQASASIGDSSPGAVLRGETSNSANVRPIEIVVGT